MKDKLKNIQTNKSLLEQKISEYEDKLKQISHKTKQQFNPQANTNTSIKDIRTSSVSFKSGHHSFGNQDDSGHGRKAFQPLSQNTVMPPNHNNRYRDCHL